MSVQELLNLPAEARAELAAALLASLEPEADADADAEWGEEVRRRVDDVTAGRAAVVPWADARGAILSDQALAARFVAALDAAVERVEHSPQGCSPHRHGTRACPLRRFPFSPVFVEQPTRSVVIAAAHHRRRPGYWRRRVP